MDETDGRVVVVGGGLAGLAAAVALAGENVPVTLLESRPRLGGRASSIVDRETGTTIDNCQHVSLGCCTNYRHFCETIGIADRFDHESRLTFIGLDGRRNALTSAPLPAPLHLFPAFRNLSYLDAADRRALARGVRALARERGESAESEFFSTWLERHDQPPPVVERFWFVVLVSALSESLDRLSVAAARKVVFDAFLANRRGWTVEIPAVPLDELYGEPLLSWLGDRGTIVRTSAGVERLDERDGLVRDVFLRSGERIAAADFVLAVPHRRFRALLPSSLADDPEFVAAEQLQTSPISSVHLWFDRAITDLPHAVLVERTSQWMFARGEGDAGHYYQVVISASRDARAESEADLIAHVVGELRATFPAATGAELRYGRRITEHDAVFSPLPGTAAIRPRQQTAIPNLQLAGDWTRTGWPATMEGAVRSGYLAAENVLARRGRSKSLVQPDLPVALGTRWLLGNR